MDILLNIDVVSDDERRQTILVEHYGFDACAGPDHCAVANKDELWIGKQQWLEDAGTAADRSKDQAVVDRRFDSRRNGADVVYESLPMACQL